MQIKKQKVKRDPSDSVFKKESNKGSINKGKSVVEHLDLSSAPDLLQPLASSQQQAYFSKLQQSHGNQFVQRMINQPIAETPHLQQQVAEKKEEEKPTAEPPSSEDLERFKLWVKWKNCYDDITPILAAMEEWDPYFDNISRVHTDFFIIRLQLESVPIPELQTKLEKLINRWNQIKQWMEESNRHKIREQLKRARKQTEQLRIRLVYAYRDIYDAGEEPEDVEVGDSNMSGLAENVKSLLNAVNEADAKISGRNVTPIIPVLDKTLDVVKLITGWKVTSGLASESQKGMAALKNAWELANTGLSLIGVSKFLPFFSHIGPLLDGIIKGWDRIVNALREQNLMWWKLEQESFYYAAEPGGKPVEDYMKAVFKAKEPLKEQPQKEVIEFFDENREMFSRTAREVMESWKLPTESSWLFWEKVDPDKLNEWVFYNKEMVWMLIKGRGWDFPSKK